ncbi:MAG: hypothetical protein HY831_01065 [Candidatus Aenigmarchaeota archaeon]|nr:hypothetical protein [Candidatus Aenigmarchaeota archaeon]
MKFIIVNEIDNPHLKRKEIMVSLDHVGGATPSMAGLQSLLSKEFKLEAEKIEIKNIFSLKGRHVSKAKVFLWEENKVDDMNKPKEEPKQE